MLESFNKILSKLGHKYIFLEHKGKVIKEGVLVNHKCNPFFAEINLETPAKEDIFKLLYPFGLESHDDDYGETSEVYMDYRIGTLNKPFRSEFKIEDVSPFSNHKFLDSIVSLYVKVN